MKGKIKKRGIVGVLVTSMILGLGGVPGRTVEAGPTETPFNYAEAFQKSMYFYDANMCGEYEGELAWRGDCHLEDSEIPLVPMGDTLKGTNMSAAFIADNMETLDPDGDGCVDLQGGYHDAGDHVKFGLPQSYAGATLGWGYYEFRDAYVKISEQDHIENILRHFNDYFLRCTFRNEDGEVVAFAYQVGEGTSDHCYWGPPELQTTDRPAWFATTETPASDQCAGAAAALAINYLNFKDTDPQYAEKSLDTAIALYEFAKENRGLGYSGGFYNSSFDEDEMSWAAVWLNIATGEQQYITDITAVDASGNYIGYMGKILNSSSDTWQNIWVHSWDTVWGGVFAKLAPITNSPQHWYFFRWNIEYWSGVPHQDTTDQTFMAATPDNFKVISTWGSCRYNTAAQLCALVYNKYKTNQDFVNWCKDQMDYILGDNPMNRCYMVGYSDISAVNPHHRAAHGSLTNSMLDPAVQRHTLWGALVGGPDATDHHEDITTDFVYNEVAVDYNAGFVGALAALYLIYGQDQEPLENFPPQETDAMPYFASAKLEQENGERTQVTVTINNDTSLPPKVVSTLKARYYFDISELLEAGQSVSDIDIQVMYDQALISDGKATGISDPIAWDEENGIYYIELDWTGDSFHGSRQIHFAIVPGMDSQWKVHWDPTNDWSRQGITDVDAVNSYIPVYLDNELVYGSEPEKGVLVEDFNVAVTAPEAGTIVDCIDGSKTVDLSAAVTGKIEAVSLVEFYVNGEKIGEDATAPYTTSYFIDKTAVDSAKKNYEITAKVISTTGKSAESSGVIISAVFIAPQESVIDITSPIPGAILDVTQGVNSVAVVAEQTEELAGKTIEKIAVYADGVKIGESAGNKCSAAYIAPDSYGPQPDGYITVKFTAIALLDDGSEMEADPYTLSVKLPVKTVDVEGLTLTANGVSAPSTCTIQEKIKLANTGSQNIDLSKVTVRYYFTKEANVSQQMICDHAGMTFNGAPWYLDATANVKGRFASLSPAANADTYCEIYFSDLNNTLNPNQSIDCDLRIVNSDWSFFNQENDYSYLSNENIVVYYDGVVISGVEPK
ncbi:glycoside hydrolase family 9 protein [Anaeromicropila populeti]|uniref:Cellulose binding domain-containing protein n=1 Tax=Anaeromicropila populeti TaxID=37658 RepID=A0A1I6JQ59_9FIRM|nr:glycoside hydrolase family 9 protein [Anaeromicropila populeti]SFR81084.1 Cellulose binding domain-containing protein [Anaeromicropila populeti]